MAAHEDTPVHEDRDETPVVRFEIRLRSADSMSELDGHGEPGSVDVQDLSGFLKDLGRLRTLLLGHHRVRLSKGASLALVSISPGSTVLAFDTRSDVKSGFDDLADSYANDRLTEHPKKVVAAFSHLVEATHKRGYHLDIGQGNGCPESRTWLHVEKSRLPYRAFTTEGDATLVGICTAVDAKTDRSAPPSVTIVLLGGNRQNCTLPSVDVARHLGEHLGSPITLRGVASWEMPSGELQSFMVSRADVHRTGREFDALNRLCTIFADSPAVTDPAAVDDHFDRGSGSAS